MNAGSTTTERTPPQLAPGAPLLRMTLTGAEGEQSVETLGPVTLIGSRKDCHFPISNTDVSKVHCAICNTGREIIACDLRSRTGTFVNDAQINSAVLRPGDRLRIGNVEIALTFVRQAGETPAGEASDGPRGEAVRFKLPLHVNGVGKERALTTQPVLIGKRANCEVFIDTPDVSLAHALIFTVDERPILCDLGSRSGTLLNGQRVATAYLRDGDTLNVGGEALAIGWKGPAFDERPAAEAPAAQPAAARTADVNAAASAAASAILNVATGGSGDDFSSEAAVIANVFNAVKKQRGELERRQNELERREGDLDKLALSICDERVLLEQAQAELAQERQKFETEAKSIDTQRAEIEAGREAMNNTLASIQARESALDQRRGELETRERDLVARAEQLEEQESDVFALVRQVADAQLALEQALGRLQDATKAAEAAAGVRPFRKKARPEAATPRADGATNGAAQHNGHAAPSPEAPQIITVDSGPLPAPVVDQPIFGGEPALAAADLPPYVQERLKVLRRVSRKSEQELLAQVLAEHQTREAAVAQAAEGTKSGKSKRRWFS